MAVKKINIVGKKSRKKRSVRSKKRKGGSTKAYRPGTPKGQTWKKGGKWA